MNNNSETDIYYKNTMNSNSEHKENKMAIIPDKKILSDEIIEEKCIGIAEGDLAGPGWKR